MELSVLEYDYKKELCTIVGVVEVLVDELQQTRSSVSLFHCERIVDLHHWHSLRGRRSAVVDRPSLGHPQLSLRR